MGIVSLALIGAGIVLIAVGYRRAIRPYARYRALRAEDANVARYEAWRGGRREAGEGSSIAMQVLLRQAQREGLVAVLGFVLVLAGFLGR